MIIDYNHFMSHYVSTFALYKSDDISRNKLIILWCLISLLSINYQTNQEQSCQ